MKSTNLSARLALLAATLAVGFVAGRSSSTPEGGKDSAADGRSPAQTLGARAGDSLATAQSSVRSTASAARETDAGSAPAGDASATLLDPARRESAEKFLRAVPYAFLKNVYLDRQDTEWKSVSERYLAPPEDDEKATKEWADGIFRKLQLGGPDEDHFQARGEWKLRDGKTVPFVAFANLYASGAPIDQPGDTVVFSFADSAKASEGKDLCWGMTIYLKVGDHYVNEGRGACLNYTSQRNGLPYAVHTPYTKRLAPYFDSLGVPLPGFGSESAPVEWYDSVRRKWHGLASLRWETVSKADYQRIQKDIQAETVSD